MRPGVGYSSTMTRDEAPSALGYWPVRLLPALAVVVGGLGLVLPTRGSTTLVAAGLILAAAVLERTGWARSARSHGRSLAMATVAGAAVCALLLVISGGSANAPDPTVVAKR